MNWKPNKFVSVWQEVRTACSAWLAASFWKLIKVEHDIIDTIKIKAIEWKPMIMDEVIEVEKLDPEREKEVRCVVSLNNVLKMCSEQTVVLLLLLTKSGRKGKVCYPWHGKHFLSIIGILIIIPIACSSKLTITPHSLGFSFNGFLFFS